MEIDILMLPIKVSIGIVLWTFGLLTYRAIQTVIDGNKNHLKHTGKHKSHTGPPSNDAVPPDCVNWTGEYFLKSYEPCTSTGVISGDITHISNGDGFWMSHPDPGYSQFEDTLHMKLTGMEVSGNTAPEVSRTERSQTVLNVEESPTTVSEMSPTLSQSTLNPDWRSPDYECGYLQNTYFNEALSTADVIKNNQLCGSDGTRLRIADAPLTNQSSLERSRQHGHPINLIPNAKSPDFPDGRFSSPKYGKLRKVEAGLRIPSLASPPPIITHEEKTIVSDFASDGTSFCVLEFKNHLGERLRINDNLRENANPDTGDIPIPTPDGFPNPPIELPKVQPYMSDLIMDEIPPDANPENRLHNPNMIIQSGAEPGYPHHDINEDKGLAYDIPLEEKNSRLKSYCMTDDYGKKTALLEARPLTLMTPCITPRVKKSPISYSNGFELFNDNNNCVYHHCSNNVNESVHGFEIVQKIRTPCTDDNQMQIHDQIIPNQGVTDLLGSISPAHCMEPSLKPVMLQHDGVLLPDGREVQERLTKFGETLDQSLPPVNMSLTPITQQLKIPDENNPTVFSETLMIPLDGQDLNGTNLMAKYLGYFGINTKNQARPSGDILKVQKHIPKNITLPYNELLRTPEGCPNSMTLLSGDHSSIQHPPSLVQNTVNSFQAAMTRTASGYDFIGNGLPDSDPVQLETFSVQTGDRGGEASPIKSTIINVGCVGEEGSEIFGIEKLSPALSPDQQLINTDADVLRNAILSRRRSSSNSSSMRSTSEDSLSFSSFCPDQNGCDQPAEDPPKQVLSNTY